MFSLKFAQKRETVDVQPKCLSFAKLMAKKLKVKLENELNKALYFSKS